MNAPARGPLETAIEDAVERVLQKHLRPLEDALRRIQGTASDDLLTIEQAKGLTGYSVRTLRARAKKGTLPGFKPPGSSEWRFRRGELLRALGENQDVVDNEAEARRIARGG